MNAREEVLARMFEANLAEGGQQALGLLAQGCTMAQALAHPKTMLSLLTYMLVLLAFSFSSVSYSGAIREISVVFAAFIGWRWLGEGFGRARLLGSLLIFAGILVIALAG